MSSWRDKARAFAAGGSAVLGATELQRLLVLKEQLPGLSGELQEKAERKVVTLRSELQRLIESAEDAFLVIDLAELLVEGRLVDEAWGATTLQTLRERLLADDDEEATGADPSAAGDSAPAPAPAPAAQRQVSIGFFMQSGSKSSFARPPSGGPREYSKPEPMSKDALLAMPLSLGLRCRKGCGQCFKAAGPRAMHEKFCIGGIVGFSGAAAAAATASATTATTTAKIAADATAAAAADPATQPSDIDADAEPRAKEASGSRLARCHASSRCA